MTDTPFDDEGMLRARFESAVGGLTPDIGRLVADGAAEGRGAVRRRRIVSGVAAGAVAVIAVGTISLASQNDLFGKGDHATNNNQLEQLEAATPRGLAAAVMSHTQDLGTPFAVGGDSNFLGEPAGGAIGAQVAYKRGEGGVEIDVYTSSDRTMAQFASCKSGDPAVSLCRPFTLDDGTRGVYLEYGSGQFGDDASPAAAAAVVAIRDDGSVYVLETVQGSRDLALDRDALTAIVTDPAVGPSTTAAFNMLGEQIADFQDGGLITSESDSGSSSGGGSASPPTVATEPATPTSGSTSSGSGRSN